MRISDWSSDVCSSDLAEEIRPIQSDRWIAAMKASNTELENYKRAFLVNRTLAESDLNLKSSQLLDDARAAGSGPPAAAPRTEERRVGQEGVSTCSTRGSPYN